MITDKNHQFGIFIGLLHVHFKTKESEQEYLLVIFLLHVHFLQHGVAMGMDKLVPCISMYEREKIIDDV